MFLPIIVFSALLVLLVTEVLFPEKEEQKTPEQELKDAITKYIAQALDASKDKD
jgi:hypothetical protein